MNKDFRVSTGFFRNHKTVKLRRRLGADGVFSLLALWGYAAETKPDGVLHGLDEEDIAIAAEWSKDAGALIATLCEVGFVEQGEDGVYRLHDWCEHNPYVVGTVERSNKGRLSRLAGTNRPLYEKIRAAGYEGITADELEAFKKSMRLGEAPVFDRSQGAQGSERDAAQGICDVQEVIGMSSGADAGAAKSHQNATGMAVQVQSAVRPQAIGSAVAGSGREVSAQAAGAAQTTTAPQVQPAVTVRQRGVTNRSTPSPSPSPSPSPFPAPSPSPSPSPAPAPAQGAASDTPSAAASSRASVPLVAGATDSASDSATGANPARSKAGGKSRSSGKNGVDVDLCTNVAGAAPASSGARECSRPVQAYSPSHRPSASSPSAQGDSSSPSAPPAPKRSAGQGVRKGSGSGGALEDRVQQAAKEVIAHLNSRRGTQYRALDVVAARLREGATLADCKAVIDAKMQDPYFRENPRLLNPTTLFRPANFERYLEESRNPPAAWSKQNQRGSQQPETAEQWKIVMRLAREGRYAERMANHLNPAGVKALLALGGLESVGAANSYEIRRLKKRFEEAYTDAAGA